MTEKALLLGSNSFSGSHCAAKLLGAGFQVLGVSRSPEPDKAFLPHRWREHSGFSFCRLDLNRDLDALMALVEKERPAYVVNFAAQGMVAESWRNPGDWFRTNTLAQVLFHDRLRQCGFLKKYVHVSTPEVYGATPQKLRESSAYHPTTPYAVSRAAADMSLASFFHAYGFPAVLTRAANVYGPGQQLHRLIPRTAMAALGSEKMRLDNGGASRRSFIHIRDVAEATLWIMLHGRPGDAYHLSTDRLSTVREIAEMTARAAGARLEDVSEAGPGRLAQDDVYDLDSSKIRSESGWRDSIGLEEGIAETVGWVRENWRMLSRQPLAYSHKT